MLINPRQTQGLLVYSINYINYKYYNYYNYYSNYNNESMTNTTISINQQTKRALLELGSKGETYDVIIKKLIERHAWKKMDERWNKILAEDDFIPLDDL